MLSARHAARLNGTSWSRRGIEFGHQAIDVRDTGHGGYEVIERERVHRGQGRWRLPIDGRHRDERTGALVERSEYCFGSVR